MDKDLVKIEKVVRKVLPVLEKSSAYNSYITASALQSIFAIFLDRSVSEKNLETARSFLDSVKSSVLNKLSENGWQ